MNNIMEIDGIECYEQNGTAYLKLETVAIGLGFTRTAPSGNQVIIWSRVAKYLEELDVHRSVHDDFPHKLGKDGLPEYIPENVFYRLAMKAKNKVAEAFQAKIADEVIPSIRRTGSYGVPNGLADTIIKLAECVNNLSRRIEALESTPQKPQELLRLPAAMQEVFDEKERKRWTHKVFYKLDCIRDGLAYSHKETLSCCYKYVERVCNADLNDERLKYMETTGENKSVLEIIYANINFRRAFMEAIDYFYNNAIS